MWTEKHPKNAGSFFAYIDECEYLAGIVAGYASKTGKLGFVGAKPIRRPPGHQRFTLGAGLVNPKVTTQWYLPG